MGRGSVRGGRGDGRERERRGRERSKVIYLISNVRKMKGPVPQRRPMDLTCHHLEIVV